MDLKNKGKGVCFLVYLIFIKMPLFRKEEPSMLHTQGYTNMETTRQRVANFKKYKGMCLICPMQHDFMVRESVWHREPSPTKHNQSTLVEPILYRWTL